MLISDLSDFQEKFSDFDRKDKFKDGLQGRSEIKRSSKRQRKKLGAGYDRAAPRPAVLQWQKGRTVNLPPCTAAHGPVPCSTVARATMHGRAPLLFRVKCRSRFNFSGGLFGGELEGPQQGFLSPPPKPH